MRRTLFTLVVAVLALVPAHAFAEDIDIRVITDYVPGDEFTAARVRVTRFDDGTLIGTREQPAFLGEDYVGGVIVGDFDGLPRDDYRIVAELRGPSGIVVGRGLLLAVVDSSRELTVFVSRTAAGRAEKTATLVEDNDMDGAPGIGDVIRYDVRLEGGLLSYEDTLEAGLRLVNGSVMATEGLVTVGNDPGDQEVVIGGLSGSGPVFVEYEAELTGQVRNQGVLTVVRPGSVNWIPTDDPSTPEEGDATFIDLACAVGACEEDLDRCETDFGECDRQRLQCTTDLGTCEADRLLLEAEVLRLSTALGELTADGDGDGVPQALELCDDTAAGVAVDDRGCSQQQFCSAIVLDVVGPNVCTGADWGADEPGTNPRDCRVSRGVCSAWP